jgi:dinuclear metal center YbgI/SA1388 family protein
VKVRDVLAEIEKLAPPHYAFSYDHIGLQVGSPDGEVSRIAVSLDSGLGAIEFASSIGAEVLICHHPVIWEPVAELRTDDWGQRRVFELARRGISMIAAHTNWDCAPGGINDVLAERLLIEDVTPFAAGEKESQWKLVVFAPVGVRDVLINALSNAGAGVIGAYERCAFVAKGLGTFVGGEESNPVVGSPGVIEEVEEVRVEMSVRDHCRGAVVRALREVHPYEEPAFDWVRLEDGIAYRAGRIGSVGGDFADSEAFQQFVDSQLQSRSEMWVGHDRPIRRVGVVGGAAASEWRSALVAGADAFITGEVPQHVALEASESGLTILASGHYATEQPGMVRMAELIGEKCELPTGIFVPSTGMFGHPR